MPGPASRASKASFGRPRTILLGTRADEVARASSHKGLGDLRRQIIAAKIARNRSDSVVPADRVLGSCLGEHLDVSRVLQSILLRPSDATVVAFAGPEWSLVSLDEFLRRNENGNRLWLATWYRFHLAVGLPPYRVFSLPIKTTEGQRPLAPPTHIIAVEGVRRAIGPRVVTYNIHAPILATKCANLHKILSGSPIPFAPTREYDLYTFEVPVTSIPIKGSPDVFLSLLEFIYTGDLQGLLLRLLPANPTLVGLIDRRVFDIALLALSIHWINFTDLSAYRDDLRQFVKHAIQFGVTDALMWDIVDVAWRTLGEAFTWKRELEDRTSWAGTKRHEMILGLHAQHRDVLQAIRLGMSA